MEFWKKMAPANHDIFERAIGAFHAGNLFDAERLLKRELRHQPKHFMGLNLLSIVLIQLEKYTEAERYIRQALDINPKNDACLSNYGFILKSLKRYEESFARFSEALEVNPTNALTWNNRGTVLFELERYEDSVADFDRATYLNPRFFEAYCSKANALCQLKRYEQAAASYDVSLSIMPGFSDAWVGRGNVFYFLKRYGEALDAYDKALALTPDLAEARLGRGNIFYDTKLYGEAFAEYDKAFLANPDLPGIEGARLFAKLHICDWTNFDTEQAHLVSALKSGAINSTPFSLLAIISSSSDQSQCIRQLSRRKNPPYIKPVWQGEKYSHDRIRVAYLSADFRQHAVSSLIAGVFESHDRSRFDVVGMSLGPSDNSEMRLRLERAFERFIDVGEHSDDQISSLIKEMEIDILVDLMGFTSNARTDVFARRCAPIQINYLGYLATMGADYIDYIIGDNIVIPDDRRDHYTEKVVFLPNSFQPTDNLRRISDREFTRAEVGLPQNGFVFCCFNTSYKFSPVVFRTWLRILQRVEGSVLWLVETGPIVSQNLRNEAAAMGISAERLIFSRPIPLPEHQSRLRLADLFLDTLPYNAGATASDALWSGLPILTSVGDTFVGRMAASVLKAIGLPELIMETLESYEATAIDLATHPEKIAALKRKLAANLPVMPLFDTQLYTRHIEAAYQEMVMRYRAGLPPDHIYVEG